jgi:hypothetical protein
LENDMTDPVIDAEPGVFMPFAVKIKIAMKLLGDKARSEVYAAIGRGELVALKDNGRTLITTQSIIDYMARLPKAVIKPPKPRRVPSSGSARRRSATGGARRRSATA